MASCITSQWSNSTSPQIRLTVTGSNASAKIHRLSWTLEYVGHGYAPRTSGERSYSAVIDGETVASGSYDINGKTGTYTIASGTKDVSRGSSNRNISFSLSFAFNLTWSGVYSGTRSASGTYTVPSVPYNTYSFNANGGTGAPGSVTKVGGVDFTFPKGKPTRTGYTFKGWNNTEINNGDMYQPEQTVGGLPDKSIEWWANWQINTYTVKYNANGGSGAPGQQTKTYGVTLTLSSSKPTRTNYTFKGWGTSSGSTSVAYSAGASYTANASITLYAVWELAYTVPRISNLTNIRCNSDGSYSDEGQYASISFDWSTDRSVSTIKIVCNSATTNVSASGTSGHVSKVVGNNELSTEYSYYIEVSVSDSGGTTTRGTTVAPLSYIMDYSSSGGVGIGTVAPDERKMKVNIPVYLSRGIIGEQLVYAGDLNNYKTPGIYYADSYDLGNSIKNVPIDSAFYLEVLLLGDIGYDFIVQRCTTYDGRGIFTRNYQEYNDTWSGWTEYSPALDSYPPSNHMHAYQSTVFNVRFTNDWMGFYPTASDAINYTNRKGWMGYNGSTSDAFQMTNEKGGFRFNSNNNFEFYDDGQVYFDFHNNNSSADHTHRLLCQTGSNIIAYPGVTNGSDRRWKKDEAIMDPIFLNVLRQLKTKTFRFIKADKNLRIGFIAQDVLEVMDNEGIDDQPIVQQNEEDGFYGIDYGQITSLLVAGWQEHEKTITELKTEISNLREEINDLKDIIEELKTMVKGDG